MIMALQTVRYARNHARHTHSILTRLDPRLTQRHTWTFYGHAPGKRGGTTRNGFTATGH